MAVESTRPVLETLGEPRAEARVGPADAKAYELAAGEYVQIEDIQGCQVSDFSPSTAPVRVSASRPP
jgi:uncharacterized protein YcgI (DUF1989 family)